MLSSKYVWKNEIKYVPFVPGTCWRLSSNVHYNTHQSSKFSLLDDLFTDHKIVSMNALRACSAVSWPGGAAISFLFINFTIDLCFVPLVCAL